jgi:hypothetical protein
MRSLMLSVTALFLCAGCAKVTVDGYRMFEFQWTPAREEITRRAAFDLKCEPRALQISVIKADCQSGNDACVARQVGVRGCGQQAVYVDVNQVGWVLNNDRKTE